MPKNTAIEKFNTSKTKHVLEKVYAGKLKKAEAARKLGVSRKTIYSWLRKYKTSRKDTQIAPKSRKRFKRDILRIIAANPEYGPKKISEALKERKKPLSTRSVWLLLKEHNLQTAEKRTVFAYSYRRPTQAKDLDFPIHLRLTPEARKRMVEEVVLSGRKVNDVCTEFQVPRKTLAKWKKRYIQAQKAGGNILLALSDQHPEGPAHPRGASEPAIQAVLDLVIEAPELSSHKIAEKLPFIGNHGVQNTLNRNNLNLYELRQAYSKVHKEAVIPGPVPTGFLDRIRSVFEQFIPSLAPVPPPFDSLRSLRTFGPRLLKPFLFSSLIVFLLSWGSIYWLDLLTSVSTSQAIGLMFATIALFMGSLFFIYSLKYYLTLALVLSFSQSETTKNIQQRTKGKGIFNWLLGGEGSDLNGKAESRSAAGLTPDLENIVLEREPYVSIHIPFYNEERVVERAIVASTNFDYPNYEVILCDDSTDETTEIIRKYLKKNSIKKSLKVITNKKEGWTLTQGEVRNGVTLKHLHRTTRSGFKGGALRLALTLVDPRTEFISVFDADFVPYPDTLELFLKYFQATAGTLDFQSKNNELGIKNKGNNNHNSSFMLHDSRSNIAAVQGYQWHVLNKSENWVTRGVRSEYAGSYVIERSGVEIYSGLKQISGAVYMIRRDVLEEVGWETSITEDFQLTLKLYDAGYKVVYTPYIQAPAECVSTLKRLIRQRMRWAEGHSNNIRRMFIRLMFGKWLMVNGKREFSKSQLTVPEKLEFLYLSPYYLQAFFFLIGTISWLISETVFPGQLPFWTSLWGWSLVLTNFISLPLMNSVGLFLEESEERDYQGLLSFVALSYLLVPFQAYASIKGLIQKKEGPWFRTPKTGHITDVFTRGRFYRFISGILPGRTTPAMRFASSPYLALSTANNQFMSFNIKSKNKRWVGRGTLASLLIFVVVLANLASTIVTVNASYKPYETGLKTVEKSYSGTNISNSNLSDYGNDIMDVRAIFKTTEDGQPVEFIFYREPRVEIVLGKKEIHFETREIGGRRVNPRQSKIFQDREVIYEEVLPGIDIRYIFTNKELVEEFIIKDRKAVENFGDIEQRLKLTGVKLVSSESSTFSFISEEEDVLYAFDTPFAKDAKGNTTKDLSIEIEKKTFNYSLTKSLGQVAKRWLRSKDRSYPIVVDPSVIISGGIADADVDFGGNQQKLVLVSSAYYAFNNDGGRIFYRKCTDITNHCDQDSDWGSSVFLGDGGDTDNEGPDTFLDGTTIWVAWFDNSTDNINFQSINTASSDAQGSSVCSGPDMGSVTDADTVSIAAGTNGDFFVAYDDDPDIYEVTSVDINCSLTETFTDITSGSGLDGNSRQSIINAGNIIHMVWEGSGGAGGLRHNYFDVSTSSWGTEVAIDAANPAKTFGLTKNNDGDLWLHAVDGTTATALWSCTQPCTGGGRSWSEESTAPFTGQTAVIYATITHATSENDLVLSIIYGTTGTAEQAYFKTTDSETISYDSNCPSGGCSYAFTAGDLGHIASMKTVTNIADAGIVLRQGSNFEFAVVPENLLFFIFLGPFLPAALKKIRRKSPASF